MLAVTRVTSNLVEFPCMNCGLLRALRIPSLSFSEVNPVEMDTLRYDTGASRAVTLTGLANANFQ